MLPFRHITTARRRRGRGQSLVEFALVVPVLLLLVAATLDLGRVFYATITLNNAAREGALQAAQKPDSFQSGQPCNTTSNLVVCRVQLEAKDSMIAIADGSIDMDCSVSGCPKQSGSYVTVSVEGTFRLLTPLLSAIFGGQTLDLDASATAQVEYFPPATAATLPPGPVAVIQADQLSGNAPLTVNFDASGSSGTPTDWQWQVSDGTVATGSATFSHTFTTPGEYTVTVTAINLAGSDTDTVTITVNGPSPTPTATATGSPSPTPTPSCAYPANVMGMTPSAAEQALEDTGFENVTIWNDLTNGQKGRIQAQNPDHTQCISTSTEIVLHYRPN